MVVADAAEAIAGGLSEPEEATARLNAVLSSLGLGFKLALVDPRDLVPLDKNAHFMKHETFKNLVKNIEKDKALASVPFCWKDVADGRMHTLSGNHRVKGAIAAGLKLILVMYDDRPLTRQEQVAIQLSHNAINGQDDPLILKELWDEISDLGLKYYSGLDDKSLHKLAESSLKAVSDAVLSFRSVNFLFLPEEAEQLEQTFQAATKQVVCEDAYLLPLREFEAFIDAIDKAKASWSTKNNAVAFFLLLRVFERHWADLSEGWLTTDEEGKLAAKHSHPVPLASVLGVDRVPTNVALQLKRCLDKATNDGKASKQEPWKAIEEMASAYLGG